MYKKTLIIFLFSLSISIVYSQDLNKKNTIDKKSDTSSSLNKNLTLMDVDDYLTQDVCVDANDNIVKISPADCLSQQNASFSLRDMAKGERSPYYKIDQLGVQAMVSFKSEAPNGNDLWVNTWDWGGPVPYVDGSGNNIVDQNGVTIKQAYLENTNHISSPGTFDIVDTVLINEVQGNSSVPLIDWVAISATARNYWLDDCNLSGTQGAWLLFPLNTIDNDLGAYVSELAADSIDDIGCPTARSQSITIWEEGMQEYTNGLNLKTITTIHTCNNDLDINNDCYEKFFFTKEFGFTRWERWQSDGLETRPTDPNPMGCNQDWESGHYWRKFCRDFAQVTLLSGDHAWNTKSYPLEQAFGKGNLLLNGDFGYRDTTGWQRFFSTSRPTQWEVIEASSNADFPSNRSLKVSCPNCASNIRGAVYQDVNVPTNMSGQVTWGGDFSALNSDTQVIINLFELGNSGLIEVHTKVFFVKANKTKFISESFNLNSQTTVFRWQMTAQTLSSEVVVDNAFISDW